MSISALLACALGFVLVALHVQAALSSGDAYRTHMGLAWRLPPSDRQQHLQAISGTLSDPELVARMDFAFTTANHMSLALQAFLAACLVWRRRWRLWLPAILVLLDCFMNAGIAVAMTGRDTWRRPFDALPAYARLVLRLWWPLWSCRVVLIGAALRLLLRARREDAVVAGDKKRS
jgi:hypothetical protein